jgi:hypothetical protein
MLCPGQVYEATLTIRDQTGAPSSAALAITKPDGTLEDPAPTPGAGSQVGADWVITYDYTLPSAGQFRFTWSTAGPGTAPAPDVVNVREFISLTGLTEAKNHLNITTTADDDELLNFMMAATELVESKAGTCVVRAITDEWVSGTTRRILRLPSGPVPASDSVTSVTSVRPDGPTWAAADLVVNPAAGTVYRADGLPFWGGPWRWTGTAGRAIIPERVLQADKEQLRHLWENQRGSSPVPQLAGEEMFTTSAGWSFSVPLRVIELLAGDVVTPVMA